MTTGKKRVRSETATRAYPLRMTLDLIDDMINTGKQCDMSGNLFGIRAIEACLGIIKAPEGKPIELPKFLVAARINYHHHQNKNKPTFRE